MSTDDKRSRLIAAGRWLKETRERHGYPVAAEFARALGVNPSLVSHWERGVNRVTDEQAKQIADLLGLGEIEVRRNLTLWVPEQEGKGVPERPPEAELFAAIGTPEFDELFDHLIADLPKREREVAEALRDAIKETDRQQQNLLSKILLFVDPRKRGGNGGRGVDKSAS